MTTVRRVVKAKRTCPGARRGLVPVLDVEAAAASARTIREPKR